jgi:hypothetical protein
MPNDYGIKIEITSEAENAIAQMKQLQDAIKQIQDLSGTNAGKAFKEMEQNVSGLETAQARLINAEARRLELANETTKSVSEQKIATEQLTQAEKQAETEKRLSIRADKELVALSREKRQLQKQGLLDKSTANKFDEHAFLISKATFYHLTTEPPYLQYKVILLCSPTFHLYF